MMFQIRRFRNERKKGIGFLQTYPFSHYIYIDFSIYSLSLTRLIHIRHDELVALAVNIDDLNLRIFLQMLAELGDIHIH